MVDDKRPYWVAFSLVKGIGAVRFKALIDYFGDLSIAWHSPAEALHAAGLSPKIVQRLVDIRGSVDIDRYMARLASQEIGVLIWDDDHYPSRLKEIDHPPPVLYVRGEILPEDSWAVAVVGTRRVSSYGRQVTEEIVTCLVQSNITIISGLARGVDAIAHQTAIRLGGRTFSVLGSGVDQLYPPEHRALAEKIIKRGAIISDYSPGTPPESTNFPPRNRIISGLSMAVIVVEAGETSGALITAAFAADQGRAVFAVPGNIFSSNSKGTNQLIRNGAFPLLSGNDVLNELNLTYHNEQRSLRKTILVDSYEEQLLNTISHEPVHIDEIKNRTGLPVERVSSLLVRMELKGLIRQVGGMKYVAVHEARSEYVVE